MPNSFGWKILRVSDVESRFCEDEAISRSVTALIPRFCEKTLQKNEQRVLDPQGAENCKAEAGSRKASAGARTFIIAGPLTD